MRARATELIVNAIAGIVRSRSSVWAVSRAGAIAEVMEANRRRYGLSLAARLALLVGGAAAVGLGAAATLATGLGPGPFDVLVTGVVATTGLPFVWSLWLVVGVMATVAMSLGTRPGLGTAIAPIIIGTVISIVLPGGAATAVTANGAVGWVATIGLHLIGVAGIGLGAGAMIVSNLGTGTADLVAAATSSKLGRSTPIVRTALEISWVGVGALLGGAVGPGTAIVAATIGFSVGLGHRAVVGLLCTRIDREAVACDSGSSTTPRQEATAR